MAGFRWVGCWILLALSCGRTASPGPIAASAGSPPAAVGGTGGGGGDSASGSGAVPAEAGEAGDSECPVTPVEGEWIALGPDPYGFLFSSDGSQLRGVGCLGELPSDGATTSCTPLTLHADRGRQVAFVWAAGGPLGYVVSMELTSAPDRTAMAGTVWTSLGSTDQGQDIVLVRNPVAPVPPATVCSGGEPSGECFLRPLRSDRLSEARVVELGDGNLLLVWRNQRGSGARLASARFDATAGAWHEAEFIDDGTAAVDEAIVSASPSGRAMVAYRQGGIISTRAHDPARNVWSEPQVVVVESDASSFALVHSLFVYDDGDATLITSVQNPNRPNEALSHEYRAGKWEPSQVIDASIDSAPYLWTAASDGARNLLLVWVRGEVIGAPHELWFRSRTAGGAWSDAAPFYTTDHQILRPAAAIGADGAAIATWQEFLEGISSSFYSFEDGAWSEPLLVTSEQDAENRAVRFSEAGAAVAYFHRNAAVSTDSEQKSELTGGVWGAPHTAPAYEASGERYSVTKEATRLLVSPLQPRPGEASPPALSLPRCEGY